MLGSPSPLTVISKISNGCDSFQEGLELMCTKIGSSSESPETFRVLLEWHNTLCIFKAKVSRGTKLCSYLNFYSLYNMKRPASQNKWVGVLWMAFRARKAFGTSSTWSILYARDFCGGVGKVWNIFRRLPFSVSLQIFSAPQCEVYKYRILLSNLF